MSTTIATQNQPTDAGLQVVLAASDVAGNKFTPVLNGKANELLFWNGFSGSISVVLKAQQTAPRRVPGLGTVTPADKTLAIAAGDLGVFRIDPADMWQYLDTNGLLVVTYTSGNVALLCGLIAAA